MRTKRRYSPVAAKDTPTIKGNSSAPRCAARWSNQRITTIKAMKTQDANAWHEAVDNYVMAVAAVYLSGKNGARLG